MTKVGVISDTHNYLPDKVVDILKDCDYILHAGDVCNDRVLDCLWPLAKLYVVQGNNDWNISCDLQRLQTFTIDGIRFAMAHRDRTLLGVKDADILIYGHTHVYSEDRQGGRLWLNPGCCGPYYRSEYPTMAIITIDRGQYSVEKIKL